MKWFKSLWKSLNTPQSPREHGPAEGPANFTPRAMQTLALARREAERFHHNFVGTEHVLLGLIRLGQGTAVTVLGKMGIDLEAVRREVENQVGTGPDEKVVGHIPYTPRVKKVLALAAKEADTLHHKYVGTEHILLGLLGEGDGVAARVLKGLHVDVRATRQEILKELDPNYVPPLEDTAMKQESTKSLDLSKRYDLYGTEGNAQVVYRNTVFKGVKKLLPDSDYDPFSEYIEIEQANGQTIFIARHSLIRFCEHGATSGSEPLR